MLLLLATLALAHDTDNKCPPTIALHAHVQKAALKPEWRVCVDEVDLATPVGRTTAWIAWRDRLWQGQLDETATLELAKAEDNAERLLEAAEALAAEHGELSAGVLERTREVLAAQPFSVPRTRLLTRWSAALAAADGDTARHNAALGTAGTCVLEEVACEAPSTTDLPAPAAPDADDLTQCRDLGRLWARATIGGVYATDRDCVVRLAESVDGDARRTAAHLALSMSWSHRDPREAVVVGHRLATLLPDDPIVAASVAKLHDRAGDSAGSAWWTRRAAELSE